MTRQVAPALAAALALALGGCSSVDSGKVDYKAEKKLPPLEVPPDLTTPARDDRYQIPDTNKPAGSTTLSNCCSVTKPSLRAASFSVRSLSNA